MGNFTAAAIFPAAGEPGSFKWREGNVWKKEEKGKLTVRLWNAQMINGVVKFPRPEDCTIRRILRDAKQKQFIFEKNFTGLDEFQGGDIFGMAKDIG